MSDAMDRRKFLAALGSTVAAAASARALHAQQQAPTGAANVPMDASSYRPVRLESKGIPPLITRADVDALEHRLGCACPCNLSVFTCRTTDFNCQISPAMHRDILSLADGGYDEREIIDAHVSVYGVQVLMAPPRTGFNWLAYAMPFAALGGGAAIVVALLRKWQRESRQPVEAPAVDVDVTDEELARINEALRRDE